MQKTKSRAANANTKAGTNANAKASTKANTKAGTNANAKGKWTEFTAIASIPLVLVLGNSMLVPVLPDMQRELGISQFQSSLVITLFSVTAGLFIPVVGYLSDRFGRKAVIVPSLVVYGGAGILAGLGALWESYPVVIGARALQGIGAAGTAPIAMALVGDLYSGGTESQALGLTEASNGTGKVVSPIIGAALALIVWYAAFFAFPLFCALSLAAVLFLIHVPKDKSPEKQPIGAYLRTIGHILQTKGRWLVASFVVGSLGLFTLFGILFYLSEILENPPYNIDGVVKGLVLAIPLAGLVITSYTTGSLIKTNGTLMRRLMLAGLLLATVSLALTLLFNKNRLYLFMTLIALSSIGTGLLLPCLNTIITGSVDKSQRGMITSIYNSLRFLGVAAGPPLISFLMGRNETLVFGVLSALAAIALALVFFLVKPAGTLQQG